MKKIAVIGAGNIGGRYIESLLNSDFECALYIVDTSAQALKVLAEKISSNKKKVIYLLNIEELPDYIDLAAITTTSGVRRGGCGETSGLRRRELLDFREAPVL